MAPLFYFSLFEFEKLYFFAVFFTPISLNLEKIVPGIGFNLSLPSEILMLILFFIIILKIIKGGLFETKVFTHPISISLFIYLGWMLITSISSSLPLVSFKHLLAQSWFIFSLFFLPVLLFRNHKNILWFFGLYITPLIFVISYTINNHLSFGLFDKKAGNFVMQPFYNDHTSYGAVLAMFIPVLAGLLFYSKIKPAVKILISFITVLFILALVLSYTRAAWISVLCACFLAVLILSKIKIRYIAVLAFTAISLLFLYRIEIIDKLSKNKQDSSAELRATSNQYQILQQMHQTGRE